MREPSVTPGTRTSADVPALAPSHDRPRAAGIAPLSGASSRDSSRCCRGGCPRDPHGDRRGSPACAAARPHEDVHARPSCRHADRVGRPARGGGFRAARGDRCAGPSDSTSGSGRCRDGSTGCHTCPSDCHVDPSDDPTGGPDPPADPSDGPNGTIRGAAASSGCSSHEDRPRRAPQYRAPGHREARSVPFASSSSSGVSPFDWLHRTLERHLLWPPSAQYARIFRKCFARSGNHSAPGKPAGAQRITNGLPGAASEVLIQTDLVERYSRIASTPDSRPMPECFTPPNGIM